MSFQSPATIRIGKRELLVRFRESGWKVVFQ